jgi:trehalose 2-sulfotransferase
MKLEQLFAVIEETQILKKISFQRQLFFIGDSDALNYLKVFFDANTPTKNYYFPLENNQLEDLSDELEVLSDCRAIIVVSLNDEAQLFKRVQQQVVNLKINLPILKLFDDLFVNNLCQRSLLDQADDQFEKPKTSYAILTPPRSGSTFLCDLLLSTEIAGYPSEHLRDAALTLSRNCNFDYIRLLHNLMQYQITDNGVFGTKFISHFLLDFKQTKFDFAQIFNSIDKYIFLVRRDKIAQAVSIVLAQRTEVWHIRDNEKDLTKNITYQSKLKTVDIDEALLEDVEQKYEFIKRQEARMHQLLEGYQIKPLQVEYEEIVENAELQVERILKYLDITKPEKYSMNIHSQIKKMPSNISEEIISQFKQKKLKQTNTTVC